MPKKSKSVSHTDEILSQAFDSPLAQNAKFKKELEGKGTVVAADCNRLAPALYEADKYFIVSNIFSFVS